MGYPGLIYVRNGQFYGHFVKNSTSNKEAINEIILGVCQPEGFGDWKNYMLYAVFRFGLSITVQKLKKIWVKSNR